MLFKIRKILGNKSGFTLVEIVLAIAVFAIVAATISVIFMGFTTQMAQAKLFDKEKNAFIEQFESNAKGYVVNFTNGIEVVLGEGESAVKLIAVENYTKTIDVPNSKDVVLIEGKNCTFQKLKGKIKFVVFISNSDLVIV